MDRMVGYLWVLMWINLEQARLRSWNNSIYRISDDLSWKYNLQTKLSRAMKRSWDKFNRDNSVDHLYDDKQSILQNHYLSPLLHRHQKINHHYPRNRPKSRPSHLHFLPLPPNLLHLLLSLNKSPLCPRKYNLTHQLNNIRRFLLPRPTNHIPPPHNLNSQLLRYRPNGVVHGVEYSRPFP